MTFELNDIVMFVVLAAAATWTLYGASRVSAIWAEAKQRHSGLVEAQKREAKALLKSLEEIDRLDTEIREGRGTIETTVQATAALRQKLADLKPPVPVDIYVAGEFPASKKDRPWVVRLTRETGGRSGPKDERLVLVWASDHGLALARGNQMLGRKGYETEAANRLA